MGDTEIIFQFVVQKDKNDARYWHANQSENTHTGSANKG